MKKSLLKAGMVLWVLYALAFAAPGKAHAHADFLVTVTRMVTVMPPAIVRGGLFLIEGAVDGLIEGAFDRKGFFHGESRYL